MHNFYVFYPLYILRFTFFNPYPEYMCDTNVCKEEHKQVFCNILSD